VGDTQNNGHPALTGFEGDIAVAPEPPPVKNDQPAVADMLARVMSQWGFREYALIAQDILKKKEFGVRKYGTPLQPFNGRRPLVDVYQELLDALQYEFQAWYEAVQNGEKDLAAELNYQLTNLAACVRDVYKLLHP
jgi:hypothetical protein